MGKGKIVAGFVCSIIGIVFGLLSGVFSIIGLPVAIVGLIMSIKGGNEARSAGEATGLATAGLVLGIIATVFSGIAFFSCGLCVLCAGSSAASLGSMFG